MNKKVLIGIGLIVVAIASFGGWKLYERKQIESQCKVIYDFAGENNQIHEKQIMSLLIGIKRYGQPVDTRYSSSDIQPVKNAEEAMQIANYLDKHNERLESLVIEDKKIKSLFDIYIQSSKAFALKVKLWAQSPQRVDDFVNESALALIPMELYCSGRK